MSIFHIVQKVALIESKTSKGEISPEVKELTVVEIERIECKSIPSYFRITAIGQNGKGWYRASDKFFRVES